MIHSTIRGAAAVVFFIGKRIIINVYSLFSIQQVFRKERKENNISYNIRDRKGSLIPMENEVHHITTIFVNIFQMSFKSVEWINE